MHEKNLFTASVHMSLIRNQMKLDVKNHIRTMKPEVFNGFYKKILNLMLKDIDDVNARIADLFVSTNKLSEEISKKEEQTLDEST